MVTYPTTFFNTPDLLQEITLATIALDKATKDYLASLGDSESQFLTDFTEESTNWNFQISEEATDNSFLSLSVQLPILESTPLVSKPLPLRVASINPVDIDSINLPRNNNYLSIGYPHIRNLDNGTQTTTLERRMLWLHNYLDSILKTVEEWNNLYKITDAFLYKALVRMTIINSQMQPLLGTIKEAVIWAYGVNYSQENFNAVYFPALKKISQCLASLRVYNDAFIGWENFTLEQHEQLITEYTNFLLNNINNNYFTYTHWDREFSLDELLAALTKVDLGSGGSEDISDGGSENNFFDPASGNTDPYQPSSLSESLNNSFNGGEPEQQDSTGGNQPENTLPPC